MISPLFIYTASLDKSQRILRGAVYPWAGNTYIFFCFDQPLPDLPPCPYFKKRCYICYSLFVVRKDMQI